MHTQEPTQSPQLQPAARASIPGSAARQSALGENPRQSGEDSRQARIAARRIPEWMPAQLAVAEAIALVLACAYRRAAIRRHGVSSKPPSDFSSVSLRLLWSLYQYPCQISRKVD